jgi:hypothetical protein
MAGPPISLGLAFDSLKTVGGRWARPINWRGYIATNNVTGAVHAFLLTPLPEPAALPLTLAGMGLLGAESRRRKSAKR